MLSAKQKSEQLTKAVREFHLSQKTADDYLDLFVTVHSVTKSGMGLDWNDVTACIAQALEETGKS